MRTGKMLKCGKIVCLLAALTLTFAGCQNAKTDGTADSTENAEIADEFVSNTENAKIADEFVNSAENAESIDGSVSSAGNTETIDIFADSTEGTEQTKENSPKKDKEVPISFVEIIRIHFRRWQH